MPKTPGKMHMYDMVKIDTIVFEIVGGVGEAFNAPPPGSLAVTELMWGLHWLPIRARIQYKLLLLVHKAFIGGSPPYLADMMITRNTTRSTRSSHRVNLLVVPHHGVNKYSEKAFAVAGPRLWNELLTDELRGCSSLDTFKKKLKTLLFQKHY